MAVGFDFGTTNSLISVISRGKAIDIVDVKGLPFPSIVRYEGESVIVGREAKEAIDTAGFGIHGNTVKSPKFLLGEESVHVGGVERSPVDIVHDVIQHVKTESLRGRRSDMLDGVREAVVTIPVNMDGPRRAALRDAFRRADIGIVQFVHEPFAALYGFVRGQDDPAETVRSLNRRNVLVVDWGGGTLDLTLCRIDRDRVLQLRNGGSDEMGGDRFDEAIRNEVMRLAQEQSDIPDDARVHPEAYLRLLHDAEANKIALSDREFTSFYRPDFFSDPSATLNYKLTREKLDEITRPLIMSGIHQIDALLESAGIGPSQVAMCLVAGGMASMPAIRGRLNERFGPQRVEIPSNSATLVAQGAAWMAHDARRLHLAKPIELQLARGSFLTLIKAGTEMPAEREVKRYTTHLFCTDPADGSAKFEICTPKDNVASPQISDQRSPLGILRVGVHNGAKPFQERLELEVSVDDDLILSAHAFSSMTKDDDGTSIHDLEFGLRLPELGDLELEGDDPTDVREAQPNPGGLAIRANVSDEARQELVPGELLYKVNRGAFERHGVLQRATLDQISEHLYYQPCAVCKRDVNDSACRCAS